MLDIARLKDQLKLHEGLRLKPYRDTVGKLTIGYGRNLDDRGITVAEADYMLENDIQDVEIELQRSFPWFKDLSDTRQVVIGDMAFNMGLPKLKGFTNMIRALSGPRKDYDRAADEMMNSKWAGQVKGRADRLSAMMRSDN